MGGSLSRNIRALKALYAVSVYPIPQNGALTNYNAVALEAIRGTQKPVYPEPRLRKGRGIRTAVGKTGPDREHRRRKGTRELNGDLSKYFLLAEGKLLWESTELLLKGKHESDHSIP